MATNFAERISAQRVIRRLTQQWFPATHTERHPEAHRRSRTGERDDASKDGRTTAVAILRGIPS